jgi:chaperonin GroES
MPTVCDIFLAKEFIMNVHPIRDQIVVKAHVAKQKEGLIIRPDSFEEKYATGTVLAVGSGRVTMSGAIVPLDIVAGDVVRFNKSVATEIELDQDNVYVLREDAVTCVLR